MGEINDSQKWHRKERKGSFHGKEKTEQMANFSLPHNKTSPP